VFGADGRLSDARIVDVNHRFLELFGFRKEEVLGRLATEVFGPAVSPVLHEFFLAVEEGKPRHVETPFPAPDRHLLISVAPFGDSQFATVVTDITERKRIELALERERVFTNALIESIPGIFYVYDSQDRLIRWNRLHEELTGFSAEELYHKSAWDWVPPADRTGFAGAQENIRTKGYNIARGRLVCKSGETRPFLMTAVRSPIAGEFYMVGIGIDMEDLEKAEQAKAELERQLAESQKLESLGRLAGGVAHDFNNLLTVINGYAELLGTALPETNPSRPYAVEIGCAGAQAAELTKQLLAFSRKQIIQPRPLDLNSVIKEAENMIRRLVGEDIAVSTALEPALGSIVADPSQIYQVLLNLVANARDAMPEGGSLRIETANVEFGEDYARTHPETVPGPCVLLAVTDSGAGMTEDVRLKIFEPFFTTKEKGRGTGLGLAMVYGIVRQSGGWIWVYSEPGHGTAFKSYFPRTDTPCATATTQIARAHPRGGNETILVVEDQEPVRSLIVTILEAHGFRVVSAGDGEQALALAEACAGPIDLLLTDVVLPAMNGRQLAERLQERRPATKVLFTSGYSEDVIANRGVLKAGVAYLPKPFSKNSLLAKVREVLDA
jgi:PAS domain S-box-containing protein